MRSTHKNRTGGLMARSLLLLMTMMFGGALPAAGLVGLNPPPAHALYGNKLAGLGGLGESHLLPAGFTLFAFGLVPPLQNNRPLQPSPLPTPPAWSRKQTRPIDPESVTLEVSQSASVALPVMPVMSAAAGGDGDKPPDRDYWKPDPEPQPGVTLVLDPVQKCLQQKRQLLRILRIRQLWATLSGDTTLARILSDRIMVIEADLLDLEISGPAMIHPGLVQEWLATDARELNFYHKIASGAYSGRQAGSRDGDQPSGTAGESAFSATSQATVAGQVGEATGSGQSYGSTIDDPGGGDGPQKPPAEQIAEVSVATCSKCKKVLDEQEKVRIANGDPASELLCNQCLNEGTKGEKRARRPQEKAGSDSVIPPEKKSRVRDRGKKRSIGSGSTQASPAKKRKSEDTLTIDDHLKKIEEKIPYPLSEEQVKKVQELLHVFKGKNIFVKETFYNLLRHVEKESFNGFIQNTTVFFWNLPEKVKNTGMLTSMLYNTKKHIRDFAARRQAELSYLANLDILSSLSSMNSRKGLPKREDVEAVMGWTVWYLEGQFNMELFRAFSSMNSGKGLPKREGVEAVMGWTDSQGKKVWYLDGRFNMELLRAFSSMNNGKGLPKREDVEAVMGWPVWYLDGQFNMELFRAFSSMTHGKGLPKREDVEAVMGWTVWYLDGQFNMELLRAFSSMTNGKGLPKEEEVKAMMDWTDSQGKKVWYLDGQFNMALFRAFSSMNNGKGLPKREDVEAVMGWTVWYLEGQFNLELFRAFSSMNNGKGLPKREDVEAVMGWTVWFEDGKFKMKLFHAFSSMTHGKGLPKEEEVKAVMDWVNCRATTPHELLAIMTRLWLSKGLPAIRALQQQETNLTQKLTQWWSGKPTEENSDSDEDDDECNSQIKNSQIKNSQIKNSLIKIVALYLSTPLSHWSLDWQTLTQFQEKQTDAEAGLLRLTKLLSSYGGKGVVRYLGGTEELRSLLLSGSAPPLPVLDMAINEFSSNKERERFIFFVRRMKSLPNKDLWSQRSEQLQRLSGILEHGYMQRLYWETLQPLSREDQTRYLDATYAQSIFDVLPALYTLRTLSEKHSRQWLKQLLEACLGLKNHNITKEGIPILFEALLTIQYPLNWGDHIPAHCLSGMRKTDNNSVEIPVSVPIQTGEELALSFIKLLMWELKDMLFSIKGQWLEVEELGDSVQIRRFPVPQLKIYDDKIEISNWSKEQLRSFLKLIELPEQYYFTEEELQSYLKQKLPVYVQRRVARLSASRMREPAVTGATVSFTPLPFSLLTTIVNKGIPIRRAAWKSVDHHKERLTRPLICKLREKMEAADAECPDEIKASLSQYFERVQTRRAEECDQEGAAELRDVDPPDENQEKEGFGSLWPKLIQRGVFESEILELLTDYMDNMELTHLVTTLLKAKVQEDNSLLDRFRQQACRQIKMLKSKNPLFLGLDDDDYQTLDKLGLLDECRVAG